MSAFYDGATRLGEAAWTAAIRNYALSAGEPIHKDRSQNGGQIFIDQYMLGQRFISAGFRRQPVPDGSVVIVGRKAMAKARGTCLAPLENGNFLVRFGPEPLVACAGGS